MFVNYNKLISKIKGTQIPKPYSGTLSGHVAGEPFDKEVYRILKELFPNNTYRQYEYLNYLFTKNNDKKTLAARESLFKSPTILFLLTRGKNATDRWSIDNPFDEKQNDTADIIITDNNKFELIDVKTRNISKVAQPPNIISAYKLAQTCAKMIDNNDFDLFDINYFQVDWILKDQYLVCSNAWVSELFLTNPMNLYINWVAAMQIQFHVNELDQTYSNSRENWARSYLCHFTTQARKRSNDMIEKFVKPFEKYI